MFRKQDEYIEYAEQCLSLNEKDLELEIKNREKEFKSRYFYLFVINKFLKGKDIFYGEVSDLSNLQLQLEICNIILEMKNA